ncbi:hypothetical protein CEE35_07630 [Candidatus Aerophobetes bacterium Ae_b3b]|nr:MAG: hypothetical protein CEE35_07630 [Candidatus Aerophobetes bacterium Ae_b3b]
MTYQNNMIIYMWNRKETIIPEKQTARKPEKNLGFTSKFASPDWTMLITNPSCSTGRIEWLAIVDDFRNFCLSDELDALLQDCSLVKA